MKLKKLMILGLTGLLLLTGCASQENKPETEKESVSVIQGGKGEYSILTPFKTSPLRQIYGSNFREVDMIEIGRRLQDKSKDHFNPSNYNISEGSIINDEHYDQLLRHESKNYPYGLNPVDGTEFTEKGRKIQNPTFVRDVVEVNFHSGQDINKVDGVGIALVMKRVQTEAGTGLPIRLSDETLYEVARTSIGNRLISYLRTIEGMSDVPIYLVLYAQESDTDTLPGKYLPGRVIGEGFFESRGGQFEQTNEKWTLLGTQEASEEYPETSSDFSVFKREVVDFMNDESIGVTGKMFVIDKRVQQLDIDLTTGAKTYLEIYGLAQYVSERISAFSDIQAPITVNIKVYQNSRMIVRKEPGNNKPVIITVT